MRAKVVEKFLAALHLPEAERQEFVGRLAAEDAGVAEQVRVRLEQHTKRFAPMGGSGYFANRYELLEEIGRGGMGVVHKARDLKLGRIVALKMIVEGRTASRYEVARFHAEAEAVAQLNHPGIVQIYDVGQGEGQHFFAMELIEGSDLADRVKEGGLPPRDAAIIMSSVCDAVAYAHGRGVIHRDLKPGNVLVDQEGKPRVSDFGIAKRIDDDASLTCTGQVLGTPSCMVPEQASGNGDAVGVATDVFALGAVLYALLTGNPPFAADAPDETRRQVIEDDPIPPRHRNAAIPRDLETICLKCLQKQITKRYPSAKALSQDLQRFLEGQAITARRVTRRERLQRWMARHPARAALVGVSSLALASLVILAVLWNLQSSLATTNHYLTTAKADAEAQRADADTQRHKAEYQRQRADKVVYINRLGRAQSQLLAGNHRLAAEALEECSWNERDWEWWHIRRRSPLRITLKGHNQRPVRAVQFSPDGSRLLSAGDDGK